MIDNQRCQHRLLEKDQGDYSDHFAAALPDKFPRLTRSGVVKKADHRSFSQLDLPENGHLQSPGWPLSGISGHSWSPKRGFSE